MAKSADVHLFLSTKGLVLPRWREAFRSAKGMRTQLPKPASLPDGVVLVWLRMEQEAAVEQQLVSLPANLKKSIPVIVLSDDPTDEEALRVFAAGARGYGNTHALPAVLRQMATVVLQGGLWIGESLMQRLLTATAAIPVPEPVQVLGRDWGESLTERECEVAETLARGASNKEIARQLGIAERTVKAHVSAIFAKLQVRDRLQLALIITGRVVNQSEIPVV